jgi:hypothetical protein
MRLLSSWKKCPKQTSFTRLPRPRLWLEILEDRTLPSSMIFMVTNTKSCASWRRMRAE